MEFLKNYARGKTKGFRNLSQSNTLKLRMRCKYTSEYSIHVLRDLIRLEGWEFFQIKTSLKKRTKRASWIHNLQERLKIRQQHKIESES